MKPSLLLSLALLTSACVATPESPLTGLEGRGISSIEIHATTLGKGNPPTLQVRRLCTLENPDDIRFVESELKSLVARRHDHSSPELDLVLKPTHGQPLRLRVSKGEVGPDAPASAWNTHWFPATASSGTAEGGFELYQFLRKRSLEICGQAPVPREDANTRFPPEGENHAP